MSSAQEAIQQGVSRGRVIAEVSVPISNRQLAGNDGGTATVPVIDQFPQVETLALS